MNNRLRIAFVVFTLSLPLAGCWTTTHGDGSVNHDPAEFTNRGAYALNDGIDTVLISPLAKVWRFVTPEIMRVALDKMFYNLHAPGRIISELGQAEGSKAGHETARFFVNTTIGILGLWDPAGRMGLGTWDEDFGQMFGVWGIPSGAYWVVPLVGPSSPRDFVGYLFDAVLNLTPTYVLPISILNSRAIALPTTDLAEEAALDEYLFVRDAYLQRRQHLIDNRDDEEATESGVSDDLYELDPELEEEPQ